MVSKLRIIWKQTVLSEGYVLRRVNGHRIDDLMDEALGGIVRFHIIRNARTENVVELQSPVLDSQAVHATSD